MPFHAHTVSGYWSDVGNLREYIRGNADALAGRVEVEIPGTEIRPGVWVEDDSRISRPRCIWNRRWSSGASAR